MPRKKSTESQEDVEVTELEGPVVVEETTPDGETKKVIETPGPVTIEETAPVEPTPDEPPVVSRPTSFGVVKVRQGTVTLRYSGESPVRAVQDVPSGAKYKINADGVVIVYPADAIELLKRPDFKAV